MKQLFIITILSLFLFSCTENSRARSFGGTAKIEVPCGQKVMNITWKKSDLWYSTIPMEEGYEPITHTFREESSFGVMKGTYLIIESKCE